MRLETVRTPSGARTIFLFPRGKGIGAKDKEVSFESMMGSMAVKAKFSMKDMAYQGEPAL